MLLLLARIALTLLIAGCITGLIWQFTKKSNVEPETPDGLTRNYEVRFDPKSNKYFIVNVLKKKEVPQVNWYGGLILYKDMIQADYIRDKLNTVK